MKNKIDKIKYFYISEHYLLFDFINFLICKSAQIIVIVFTTISPRIIPHQAPYSP